MSAILRTLHTQVLEDRIHSVAVTVLAGGSWITGDLVHHAVYFAWQGQVLGQAIQQALTTGGATPWAPLGPLTAEEVAQAKAAMQEMRDRRAIENMLGEWRDDDPSAPSPLPIYLRNAAVWGPDGTVRGVPFVELDLGQVAAVVLGRVVAA